MLGERGYTKSRRGGVKRGVREPAENKFVTSRPRTCAGQQRGAKSMPGIPNRHRYVISVRIPKLFSLPHPIIYPSLCDPSRRVATRRNVLRKFSVHPIDCGFSMQAIRGEVLMGLQNTGCIRCNRLFLRNEEGSE